jgi:hypothetical protein
MSEAWSAAILQVCRVVAAMALVDVVALATCFHSLLHNLQHLSLHYQYLLQCWWWRRVGIDVVVVLIGDMVASFEVEIETEIRDRDTRFPTICIKI